jgi:hypothetical protein
MSMKHPKKFKYIINDNNKHLVELFNLVKDKKKFDKFIEDINMTCFKDDKFMSKEHYTQEITQDTLKGYYISHKFYCIRAGLYPLKRSGQIIKPEGAFIDFMRNEDVIIYQEDACKIMDKYLDDEKAILFVDPPYMNSCNDFYLNPDINIYEYMFKKLDVICMLKSHICFCLEDIWIIRLLFEKLKANFIIYDKLYQSSKRQTKHIIINNHKKEEIKI